MDAIVISLAAGSIGAIYSSSSTDMGAQVRINLKSLYFDSTGFEIVHSGKIQANTASTVICRDRGHIWRQNDRPDAEGD